MTLELCSRTGDLPGGLDGLPAWQLAETTILAFQLPFSRLDILRPLSVRFLFCLHIRGFPEPRARLSLSGQVNNH